MKTLDGKVAVVTSATKGIGLACALKLAERGAHVFMAVRRVEDTQKICDSHQEDGLIMTPIYFDATVSDSYASMVKKVIQQANRIDILVNNAGITKDNLIMKMSEEEFDKVIEVNLKGAFNCMKHVSRIMLKQRSGHIINMSSVSGVMGNAGQVNYCASKAGIIGMTKSLARELGSRGITVNAIAPGFIETEMTDVLSEDVKENLLGSIPLKRMGQTKDIAETVAFLASDKAAYITGQTISVDGGMGM